MFVFAVIFMLFLPAAIAAGLMLLLMIALGVTGRSGKLSKNGHCEDHSK